MQSAESFAYHPDLEPYLEMLTYKRPNGSTSEQDFINRFLPKGAVVDKAGNYWYTVGKSHTMFSAHLDTVHRTEGRQEIAIDAGTQLVFLANEKDGCLGADDASGIWVLLEMMKAKIPGIYVFHRGEEIGGVGSAWAADNLALDHIKAAVAFDRAGTDEVLTHQGGRRCASNAYGEALSTALNKNMPAGTFKPSPHGVFTDTANYADDIPECVNIAIGYECQHTPHEAQALDFLVAVRDAALKVDWENLPIERDPTTIDRRSWDWWDDDDEMAFSTDRNSPTLDLGQLEYFVYNYPHLAVELLFDCGITAAEVPVEILTELP